MTTRQLKRRHLIWRGAATSLLGWSGWLALIALADLIAPK
ncbi:hypothetical protein QIT80_gp19 (endogenous virus) [Pseudomonas phage phiAH14a]|uniref:Uncharacterized protein n=1 Tax=Pseudomonas phage phiAH14a TaxID=1805958 RepID=A0A1B0VRI4_9CAUD|nr:hypothetical protein QIT80_gp19 [Pseudomonas phage phiAH14a]AMW64479.1 hypothetical protein AH14a_p19 [Pseudomonas phage phiAH14a]